eukprot:sb/3467124/
MTFLRSTANDFTFDVTTLFSSDTPVRKKEEDEEDSEIDFTLPDEQLIEEEIVSDVEVGLTEEVEDQGSYCSEEAVLRRGAKAAATWRRNVNFRKEHKRALALFNLQLEESFVPYVAPVTVNEELRWSTKRPLVRELSNEEILRHFNVAEIPKPFTSPKTKGLRARIKSQKQYPYHLQRVVKNEVIGQAEEKENLSEAQIDNVTNRALGFIDVVFEKLSEYNFSRKRKLVTRAEMKNACVAVLASEKKRTELLGELIKDKPVFSSNTRKDIRYTSYTKIPAIRTQFPRDKGETAKQVFKKRSRFVKDLR